MKMTTKLLLTLAAMALLGALLAFSVFAATYPGNCGTNVKYKLDTSTGVLEISGTGEMKNYSDDSRAPWYSNRSYVKTVKISDGVTSIGSNAFYYCSSLGSIEIPDSVTSIGDGAFYGCSSLGSIEIPDSVTSIGVCAFYSCSSLASVIIGDSVASIGDWAFADCSSLGSIVIPDSVTSIGYEAFRYCSSLDKMYYTGSEEEWEKIKKIGDWDNGCGDYEIIYNYSGSGNIISGNCDADVALYTETDVTVAFAGDTFEYDLSLSGTYDGYSIFVAKEFNGLSFEVVGESGVDVDDFDDVWMLSVIPGLENVDSEKTKIATVYVTVSEDALGRIILDVSDDSIFTNDFGDEIACHTVLAEVDILETYDVNYDADGGEGAPSSQKKKQNIDLTLSADVPTKIGYDFKGWNGSDGNTYSAGGACLANQDLVLTAIWEAKDVKISYNTCGGSVSTDYKTVKYEQKIGELATPTRTGYSFVGWYTEKDGGVRVANDSVVDFLEEMTIYARWKNATYLLVFDANGGECDIDCKEIEFKAKFGDLPTPQRRGYKFITWSKTKSTAGAVNSETIYQSTSDTTLYAVWEKVNYGDANGNGEIDIKDLVLLSQYLAGWNVSLDSELSDCNGDGKINIKDVVLLAQYLANWDVTLG